MEQNDYLVYFAHGLESGPEGRKIQMLKPLAAALGFEVVAPDYRHLSPAERIEKLLFLQPKANKALVLLGSSLGGYVSSFASQQLQPQGLCLLAPALYLPQLPGEPTIPTCTDIQVIHGWHDDIIAPQNAISFAQRHHANLHLLDGSHTLTDCLDEVAELFSAWLRHIKHKYP